MASELDWINTTHLGSEYETEINVRTNRTRYRKLRIQNNVPFSADSDPEQDEEWIYGDPPEKEKQ